MIIPVAIHTSLDNTLRAVAFVKQRVEDVLYRYCSEQGFPFRARVKSLESLAEKLESGRYQRWSHIDDIFACTVIVPSTSRESDVIAYLRRNFDEVVLRERGKTKKSPNEFRFDSTRFIGTLRPDDAGLNTEPTYSLRFEIQITTAFEHAWSVATHDLVYKASELDWRRIRLAAQLRASVEQLDTVVSGFEQIAELIPPSDWPEIKARKRIEDLFKTKALDGSLPSECVPLDWTRFTENVIMAIKRSDSTQRGRADERTIDKVILALENALQLNSGDHFPRSISLFQFSIGSLIQAGLVGPKFHDYYPPITRELITLFPKAEAVTSRFDFGS